MSTSKLRQPDQLRVQAIALRRAGKSVRQIKQILGPIGNRALQAALRGEPPPDWTRRPNAKDNLRTKARYLRLQGLDYEEIVAQLGVSKSSVSLWVRDLPRPPRVARMSVPGALPNGCADTGPPSGGSSPNDARRPAQRPLPTSAA